MLKTLSVCDEDKRLIFRLCIYVFIYSFICLMFVCLCNLFVVRCLTSQKHISASQGQICSDNFTCSHTEKEVADQTLYLTQSQYTDTCQPVPALTLSRPVPGRAATGVPIFKLLV